jgi:TonB-linked SusC/RagA family outer membrane protein
MGNACAKTKLSKLIPGHTMKNKTFTCGRKTGSVNHNGVTLFRKLLFTILVMQICHFSAFAQTVVSGIVSDAKGKFLPDVSVKLKGSTGGTTTGPDGKYSITVPVNGVLVFSYVGFAEQEIETAGKANIDVTLEESNSSLDAVLVVGYGTVKRRDLTGAVSSVSSEKINAFPSANVMQALAGRAAGVQVRQNTGAPGAPISIRVRGTNSIVGNNEPLYVVDGFPVSSADVINNSSIRSVEILKDASAIAIYGSRASNGVVLITTQRGAPGKSKVTLQSSYGRQQVIKKMDMMNPLEYATYYNEFNANMGRPAQFTAEQVKEYAAMGNGTDWQDVVFQDAGVQNHSLNISGGNEKTKFSITGSLFDQQGIIKNSHYKRYGANSSIQHAVSDKFSVDINLSLSKNHSRRQLSDQERFGTSLIGRAYSIPPILPVYNDDGTYMEPIRRLPFVSEALYNPLNFINEQNNTLEQKNVLLNAAFTYKILEGLTLRVAGGLESINARTDFYQTKKFQNNPNGIATVMASDYTSLLNENTLNYIKKINDKHEVSAVAGITYQDFLTKTINAGGSSFLSDIPGSHSLATAGVFTNPGTSYIKSTLLSGLARVNYTFNKRYLFTVSMRADGSSVYSPENKWGYFPSAALAWRISDENFFKGITAVQNLKLRASWGKAGSQAISPYSTLNTLTPGSTVFGSTLYTTMAPGTRLAADLKWETTEQVNFGVEFSLLSGRIQFSGDYYRKKTSDLLNAVQLPRTTGFTNSLRNVGKVANNGFEFEINSRIFDKGDFSWDLGLNMSFNRSKVLELYGGQDILAGQLQMILFTDFANTYRVGQPMGVIYGYREDGYDDKGLVKYKSTTVKEKLGDPNPDFIYGINSNMSYKNFNFTMFWSGTQGNEIVNMSAVAFTVETGGGINKLKELLTDHWTPQNTNAKYPAFNSGNKLLFSDRYVEDGSYIRLRHVELGYDLPVENWSKFPSINIYLSAQNILTFTKYSWVDPDVNSRGGANSLDQGIDYSTYPSAKTITAGIRIGF